jgi:cell envelope opacity-associated protein A
VLVHRNKLGTSNLSRRFKELMTRLAPYAAAASAALILWHAARDTPASLAYAPVPLVYPNAPAATTPPPAAPVTAPPLGTPVIAQQASVASTIQVIVGRNDTLDAIFRRMALDTSDLAAIRQLPGIRQSLDFLKPGDAIKLTHADGEIKELTLTSCAKKPALPRR